MLLSIHLSLCNQYNYQLIEATSHKQLGLHISKDYTWHEQII